MRYLQIPVLAIALALGACDDSHGNKSEFQQPRVEFEGGYYYEMGASFSFQILSPDQYQKYAAACQAQARPCSEIPQQEIGRQYAAVISPSYGAYHEIESIERIESKSGVSYRIHMETSVSYAPPGVDCGGDVGLVWPPSVRIYSWQSDSSTTTISEVLNEVECGK